MNAEQGQHQTVVAYCWATGLIGIDTTCPEGTLPLAAGPEKELREAVDVLAVHSRTGGGLLVPKSMDWMQAILDGRDVQRHAYDCCMQFKARLEKTMESLCVCIGNFETPANPAC